MKPSPEKSKVFAVLLLACVLPALISLVAYFLFGSARHLQGILHECLELSGSWIALAVAMLVWLRAQREQGSSHLMCVAAALVGMGLVDGAHAVPGRLSLSLWPHHPGRNGSLPPVWIH